MSTGKLALLGLLVACISLAGLVAAAGGSSNNPSTGEAATGLAGLFLMLSMMLAPVLVFFGFGAVWLFFFVLILFIGIVGTIFWIWMLIDCAKRDFEKENDKIVWIIVIALTHWIGALIYFIVIKMQKDKKEEEAAAA